MFYKCSSETSDDAIAQDGLNASSFQIPRASVDEIADCVVHNVLPFVDIFAMIGNFLCIIIYLSPRLRRVPTTLHLTPLAFYDLLFQIGHIPATFDGSGAEKLIETNVGCWTFRYTVRVAVCLSAWTVMAFTVERFIVVYFPLHRAAACTFKNTLIILLSLIPIPLLFNCYIFFLLDGENCAISYEDHSVIYNWLGLIEAVMANVIPLIVIAILNGLIAFLMWKNDEEQKNNQELRLHHSATSETSSVTRSLFIVSTAFAILNVPFYAIYLKARYVYAFGSKEDFTEFEKVFSLIAFLLYHVNFAGNFLLYNWSSKLFRNIVLDVLVPNNLYWKWEDQSSILFLSVSSRFTTSIHV